MREIKFRVWKKEEKKMHQVQKMSFKTGKIMPYGWNIENDSSLFELMQYTGLKDKNGKEIYEGDIITWRHNSDSPKHKGDIKFKNGCWIVEYNYPFEMEYLLYDVHQSIYEKVKVIGNIYENADLLE